MARPYWQLAKLPNPRFWLRPYGCYAGFDRMGGRAMVQQFLANVMLYWSE